MPRRRDIFTTIRTEGALLPSDLLSRVAENDSTLAGLRTEDYHLNPGEKLNELVNRSWNRAMAAWTVFQEALDKLPANDPGTTVTRERWLLVLFQEFGFGRLQTTRGLELDGKSFPVSHSWGHVPIHLVGARIDLDRRTGGLAGAARRSPHSLVQELLTASPTHVWGMVSNGRHLRLLRDNAALTRQAYVEFDLAAMMDGQVYPDFVLLWLLLHESRFEGEPAADCWLERWAKEAEALGTRALDHLRESVEAAIAALGRGFLAHPANVALRGRLRDGALNKQDYYRNLLRMVYRLLFLFVSEDRDLLLLPEASGRARELYMQFYSVGRLRRLAERRRGTTHCDLYEGLKVVMAALDERGLPQLGLPALGSFLWSTGAIGDLATSAISNRDLLAAVHSLAFATVDKTRRVVDYRNLGAEELGSVYESLLELHPEINIEAARFELGTAAGHERKSTGSYYTPTSLIVNLLDTALGPVLDQAASKPLPESVILQLRVVDPACGSGHFLIAAAHRIAKRLAVVRTGDEEPSPQAIRAALRDVIGRCVYGVDMNEMAVELCKVSLWIETLEPGKPLSFLDHHIVCGNSLLGTTPALLSAGIPDEAYKAVEGDVKSVVASLRKRNVSERAGQHWLELDGSKRSSAEPLAEQMVQLDQMADDSLQELREKERRYAELLSSPQLSHAKFAADAWCAAFVTAKVPGAPEITQSVLESCVKDPDKVKPEVTRLIAQTANDLKFHHWHLAFPDTFHADPQDSGTHGWTGGFDVVLGNPPWDKLQFEEKGWFASRAPDIAKSAGAGRKRLISELKISDTPLWNAYQDEVRRADAIAHFVRDSGRYPLCGQGRLNSYALFAELDRTLVAQTGRVGIITPTGIATDDTTKDFFADVVASNSLVSLYDFENRMLLFPTVDSRMRFCLLTIGRARDLAEFAFLLHSVDQLGALDRRFTMSAADLALFNPNTRTCPIFRSSQDVDVARAVYQTIPVLVRHGVADENPWGASFSQGLFNMTSDSSLFRAGSQLEATGWIPEGNTYVKGGERYLPLYEAKMFDFFDHRSADVVISATAVARQGQPSALTVEEHQSPYRLPMPRYWVHEREVSGLVSGRYPSKWFIAFGDVTSATNARTVVAAPLPYSAVGNNAPLVFVEKAYEALAPCLLGCLSSFALDYMARFKVGGTHLNFFIVEQLPVLPPSAFEAPTPWGRVGTVADWLRPRLLELCYTSVDLGSFARALSYDGPPFKWDLERRLALEAEVQAAFFHLYRFTEQDADRILETFPIIKRQEEARYGEFRTKARILQCFKELSQAAALGLDFETRMHPAPADPAQAHRLETIQVNSVVQM